MRLVGGVDWVAFQRGRYRPPDEAGWTFNSYTGARFALGAFVRPGAGTVSLGLRPSYALTVGAGKTESFLQQDKTAVAHALYLPIVFSMDALRDSWGTVRADIDAGYVHSWVFQSPTSPLSTNGGGFGLGVETLFKTSHSVAVGPRLAASGYASEVWLFSVFLGITVDLLPLE